MEAEILAWNYSFFKNDIPLQKFLLQANRQQVQLKINRDPPLRTDHHDGRTMLRETPKKNEAWQRISLKLQTEGYFYVGIFHDDNQFVKWAGTRKFGNFFDFLNKLRSISIQSN